MIKIFGLTYPKTGNSGGWSANAKHRPQPRVETIEAKDFNEIRRRKYTAFDMSTTPPTLVRHDYAIEDLTKLGADLPQTYCDEFGNIRNLAGKLVMAAPK